MGSLKDEIRTVTRDVQMKELHRAIGEFVVAFEHINHEIWSCIMWQLQAAGLKDQSIAQILLAKHTADPLREILKSLIAHMRPENPPEQAIVADLMKRHLKLTQDRNNYMHGTWYIGWGNEETIDWSVARGHKLDRNSSGANVKSFHRTAEDFDALTDESNALTAAFSRLKGCFISGYDVERNFDVDDNGRVSTPQPNVTTE